MQQKSRRQRLLESDVRYITALRDALKGDYRAYVNRSNDHKGDESACNIVATMNTTLIIAGCRQPRTAGFHTRHSGARVVDLAKRVERTSNASFAAEVQSNSEAGV
jgi:hypothetical protein